MTELMLLLAVFFRKCAKIEVKKKKKRENRLSIQLGELFPVFELKFS